MKLLLSVRAMAQHHNDAIWNDSLLQPGPRTFGFFGVKSTFGIRFSHCRSISAEIRLSWHWILCFGKTQHVHVECEGRGLCFRFKHRTIIAKAYWILLLKHSFVILQCQPCSHVFHEWMSATDKVQLNVWNQNWPLSTKMYFYPSQAWYTLLLYYNFQQFLNNESECKNAIIILHFLHILLFIKQS